MKKLPFYFFWALFFGVWIGIGIVKCYYVQQLTYTSDMFGLLNMSRSILSSKRWLFDNVFGYHGLIHDYSSVYLFLPFTWWSGIWGLLIPTWALFVGAWYLWVRDFLKLVPALAWISILPLSPFIFDNAVYGWHVELIYFPLSIFFIWSVLHKKKFSNVIFFALICLLKEEGPIVALCLVASISSQKNWKIHLRLYLSTAILFLVIHFFSFKIHSLLLGTHDISAASRIQYSLLSIVNQVTRESGLILRLLRDLLLLNFIPYFIIFMSGFYLPPSILIKSVICALPLYGICAIASAFYGFSEFELGIFWPPHIVALWSQMLAYLYYHAHFAKPYTLPIRVKKYGPLLGLIIFGGFQIVLLKKYQKYSPEIRWNIFQKKNSFPRAKLADVDLKVIECLMTYTYPSTKILINGSYYGLVHRATPLWIERSQKLGVNPNIVICGKDPFLSDYRGCFKELDQYTLKKDSAVYDLSTFKIGISNSDKMKSCFNKIN